MKNLTTGKEIRNSPNKFAERLRTFRGERSFDIFAKEIGENKDQLYRVETRGQRPKSALFIRLCVLLSVDPIVANQELEIKPRKRRVYEKVI